MADQPLLRRAIRRRYLLELAMEQLFRRLNKRGESRPLPEEYRVLASVAGAIAEIAEALPAKPRKELNARIAQGLTGEGSLVSVFHLAATAQRFVSLGFRVSFPDLAGKAPYDLLVEKGGQSAEVACVTVPADVGRAIHSGDWDQLVGQLDPALQSYVERRPGRYILKLSMPEGIAGSRGVTAIRDEVVRLLSDGTRVARSDTVVLKLDPLTLAPERLTEDNLHRRLETQFGHTANLAISIDGESVFVVAARSGKPDDIARGVLTQIADVPRRFSGERPAMLFTLVDDLSPAEWVDLRDRMELEVAGRELLNRAENAPVHSVGFLSVPDLVTVDRPGFARHRSLWVVNPKHPQARAAEFALGAP